MASAVASLIAVTALVVYGAAQEVHITQPTLGIDPYTGLNLSQNVFGASVLAYIYGCPLLVYAHNLANGTLTRSGVNKFRPSPGLANATNGSPGANVDTVYGEAYLDLAAQDLVLTIPPMQSDRYYSYSFFDPYSDDFQVLGTLNNDRSGKYLIRPSLKTGHAGLSTCKSYIACIDSPVLNPLLLVRVLVKYPYNQTDITYVNNYLGAIQLDPVNAHAPSAPVLQQSDFDNLDPNNVTQTFQLLANFSDRNPPQDTLLAAFNPFTLLAAGISNGTYKPNPSVNLDQVNQAELDIQDAFISSPLNDLSLPPNNWTTDSPRWVGSFENGKNLVARAYLNFGRFGNPPNQAIYVRTPEPFYTLAASGEAYVLDFSGKPLINERVGFWSLTMYNATEHLVDNPENVYALGDRNNMTYPDGAPIYRGGDPSRDGTFQILIQPADQTPPANWTNNWLPSPTGGDPFLLLLRLYAPESTATSGQYDYPKFMQIDAIV